jgi:hypothetical protein
MKKIQTHQYKEIALANLKRFRNVSETNKYAKGSKYDLIETNKKNSLGFKITEYNIIEL